ncbi:uncharacterized protein [Phyllobates terribilis]|uniref:uncharacterized protein n=1 Tax=Phyllobates terribilis TaxID=111132 RepID=UPI003CCAD954
MEMNRDKMGERILHLTLEILFRLTGEDYTVVKKTSRERCQAPVSEGWGRPLSPITGPPPHPLIHEDINDQKILELTYKMIELLTGEVPIRCQDVAIYFSMEEWEYLEGHKDLYKDVMMEDPQPLTSPVLSSKKKTPERCPPPLLPQDCKQEDPNVPQNHQGEDLNHSNSTETYVRGDEQCKEEIPTDNLPDDCTWSLGFNTDDHGIKPDTLEEDVIIPHLRSTLHSEDLSSDPLQHVLSSDSILNVHQNKNNGRDVEHRTACTQTEPFSCLECGKSFKHTLTRVSHQRIQPGEKPFSCSKCGECFSSNSALLVHNKIHTGKKPFSCSDCGKCFTHKGYFFIHKRIHTGEKPYTCPECMKCFICKGDLVKHQKTHARERPFSCSECGKCFKSKANLSEHHITHSGEKPFSCSECGNCYSRKSRLFRHQRIHTGEKPFSCSECGSCYSNKSKLIIHLRTHTGEKPFLCSECGKCYYDKSNLVVHLRTHTGEKPFACSECGKCFSQKANLCTHQRIHTGEKPFSCSDCDKCFAYKADLLKHKKSHTGGKSFSC